MRNAGPTTIGPEGRSVLPGAPLSVAVPVIAFVVFEEWFLVPMPKGPLEDWLGY